MAIVQAKKTTWKKVVVRECGRINRCEEMGRGETLAFGESGDSHLTGGKSKLLRRGTWGQMSGT